MLKVVEYMIQREASSNGRKCKNIQVHESAARYFINPKKIDYFEFKLAEGSYLFSKNGANFMMDEIRTILDQIDARIDSKSFSFYSQDDTILLEYDNNDKTALSMKLCSEYRKNESLCSSKIWLV